MTSPHDLAALRRLLTSIRGPLVVRPSTRADGSDCDDVIDKGNGNLNVCEGCDEEHAELIAAALNALPDLLSWATKARAVLERVEWGDMGGNAEEPTCPECGAAKSYGHVSSCALFALLGSRGDDPPKLPTEIRASPLQIVFQAPPDMHEWAFTSGDTHWRCRRCGAVEPHGGALAVAGCRGAGDVGKEGE